MRDSVAAHLRNITGYLYMKGLFYIHLIESSDVKYINAYMKDFYALHKAQPQLHK